MDKDTAIEINNISKQYFVGHVQSRTGYRTMRDVMTDALKSPYRRVRNMMTGQAQSAANLTDSIWALKDVSFSIKKGEVVGIIGHNGAGKSTLLKILSRITDPTEGEIAYRGRLGALLEVGTGFHPELTGRENVYLNGAILGMKRYEINAQFDEIVAFAGVEQFVDTPVKHYSSGMYVRLAFAVAAHLEPEVLIVDEVLSVGDAEFQKRSLGKMQDVAGSGRTVLFVSHNMAAVENLCSRGVVLERGKAIFDGKASTAIEHYMLSLQSEANILLADRQNRKGTGDVKFTNITITNIDSKPIDVIASGQTFDVHLEYISRPGLEIHNARVGITCFNQHGVRVFTHHTKLSDQEFSDIPETGKFICRIHELPLPSSIYHLKINMKVNEMSADIVHNAKQLQVIDGDFFGSGRIVSATRGICLVKADWSLSIYE